MNNFYVKVAIITALIFFVALVATNAHASYNECEQEWCVPIVVPSIEPTIEVTPEVTLEVTPDVTATPEATVTPTTPPSDHDDGLGCRVHDCSQHIIPAGAPATGRAL